MYIHTNLPTYTFLLTYIHNYLPTYRSAYIHVDTHTFVYANINTYRHML